MVLHFTCGNGEEWKKGCEILFHKYTHYIQTNESHILRSTLSLWTLQMSLVPSHYVFKKYIVLELLYVFVLMFFLVDKVKKGVNLQSLTDLKNIPIL